MNNIFRGHCGGEVKFDMVDESSKFTEHPFKRY
mgnify:CR=1 FL=1